MLFNVVLMFKNQGVNLVVIFSIFLFFSCKEQQSITNVDKQTSIQKKSLKALAPVIIYKTKDDYYTNVPIIMNDNKTDIISYPDIKDVYYKGELAYPTKLSNGYLLDNRGISKNVVFLKYTYEEYSNLKETPNKETLLKKIIEKNPLTEIYTCDKLSKIDIEGINKVISQGLPGICKNIN